MSLDQELSEQKWFCGRKFHKWTFMNKEIVLIGRSNVGKSTLFTQLTGKKVRIGRRPGVTIRPTKVNIGKITYVDMPGYGYMKGLPKKIQDETKDFIVHYFEDNQPNITLAIEVIDASSFLEIVDRWELRDEIPLDLELFDFLHDLGLDVAVAANKMDRVSEPDKTLDLIAERLGLLAPWRQWIDQVAPICAKKREIKPLRRIIQSKT